MNIETMIVQHTLESMLAESVYCVQANSFEQFCVWEKHIDRQWPYTQLHGWSEIIGTIEGQPVNVSVSFVRIVGRVVCFWYGCSAVVSYPMIEAWLRANCRAYAERHACDAGNFHLCMQYIATRPFPIEGANTP